MSSQPQPLATMSTEMRSTTVELLAAGVPANTRRAYAADRRSWATFRALSGQPPLPTTSESLADFAATLLTIGNPASPTPRPLAAASVDRALSAVSTWSVEAGQGRPDLRAARLVLRGHRRTAPARPRQAAPVTVGVLRALVSQATVTDDPSAQPSLRGLRDRAVVLLGFALAARRSELVRLDLGDLREYPEGLCVSLTRAKVRDTSDDWAVPWAADSLLCPVRAAITYRAALAAQGVADGALFRRVTRTGVLLPARLTPEAVGDIVHRLADAAGVPVPDGFAGWSGHSLRRGFATEARRAGADALRIARQGGWADGSTALSSYLADVDRWQGHPLNGVL